MKIDFAHRQSAHCESGVTANLLTHYGIEMSEAMAFGIGGGLFFGYFPFIKINYLPLTTFRKSPGSIFKRCTSRLGIKVRRCRFRSPQQATQALDEALEAGDPVGVQTGVYWLPYFPPALRFHFNAHNLVVYGKQESSYLISDPVFDEPVVCEGDDLARARFAKGALAPKGQMYHLVGCPESVDLAPAVRKGIREVCRSMLAPAVGLIGVKGIRFLSRQLESWPAKLGDRKALLHLGHVIRMQEEIGTGGAGFRFIYAAFLQEAEELLGTRELGRLSGRLTQTGDRWREFALLASRFVKGRPQGKTFADLAMILRQCADDEEAIFRDLRRAVR